MARWYQTRIEWTGEVPSDNDLENLYLILQVLDYNSPKPTKDGIRANWRSPSHSLETIMALLHVYGFPCRGRRVYEDEYTYLDPEGALERQSWTESKEDLSKLQLFEIRQIRSLTSRYDTGLPKMDPLDE